MVSLGRGLKQHRVSGSAFGSQGHHSESPSKLRVFLTSRAFLATSSPRGAAFLSPLLAQTNRLGVLWPLPWSRLRGLSGRFQHDPEGGFRNVWPQLVGAILERFLCHSRTLAPGPPSVNDLSRPNFTKMTHYPAMKRILL